MECISLLVIRFQSALTLVSRKKVRITTECCWSLSLGLLCHLTRPYYCWPNVTRDRDQNGVTSIFALGLILFNYYSLSSLYQIFLFERFSLKSFGFRLKFSNIPRKSLWSFLRIVDSESANIKLQATCSLTVICLMTLSYFPFLIR